MSEKDKGLHLSKTNWSSMMFRNLLTPQDAQSLFKQIIGPQSTKIAANMLNRKLTFTFATICTQQLLLSTSICFAQISDAIYWPRNEFVIPFQVDSNGQVPEEVHLEVSLDAGQSWSQCSRGDSRTRQFQYKASQDGEYLFRLKTVDSSGKLYNNPGPPLRIIVDTTKPTASLAIDMNPRGDMLAQFLVSDNALSNSSITLEYQTDVTPQWQPIPFELSNSTTPGELVGNSMWALPANANQLVVRLVVKDQAGNVTEVTRLPQLPRTANMNGGLQFASKLLGNQPLFDTPKGITNNSQSVTAQRTPGETNNVPNNTTNAPGASIQLGPNPYANRPAPRTMSEREIEELRLKNGITTPSASFNLGSSDGNFEAVASLPNGPILNSGSSFAPSLNAATPSLIPNFNAPTPQLPNSSLQESAGSDGGFFTSANQLDAPNVENDFQPSATALPRLGAPKPASKAKVEALHANTRAFSLDYKIENDPGAPITEVELWGTIDEGRTWEVWGQDPDRKSPFDIEVENDGLFGFRMVIVGANGLASNRPRSGDDADAWILVDTVKPLARINSALYGKGQEAGALIIEYTVTDDALPDRPISLFFSEKPQGPWETISSGIRNQGRYVWPTTPNLPPKIYLKIEAMDVAGNVASSILDLPIDVEGIAPRGRIQGFRPLQTAPVQ